MGFGVWVLGFGYWGLGPIPNPQSPIPNPHVFLIINTDIYLNILKNLFNKKIMINLFKSKIN